VISDSIWRLITGVLILAIIFVLVRPGSEAGTAVKDVGGALQKIVTAAVGSNGSTSTGS
jgi:hypothetical protein